MWCGGQGLLTRGRRVAQPQGAQDRGGVKVVAGRRPPPPQPFCPALGSPSWAWASEGWWTEAAWKVVSCPPVGVCKLEA